MIKTILRAICLAVLGDTAADLIDLPVPGATIGMTLLLLIFSIHGGVDPDVSRLFDRMSPHFPLFFVPAAVGVVANADLLANAWFHVAVAIAGGTTVTIVFTGLLGQFLLNTAREAGTI